MTEFNFEEKQASQTWRVKNILPKDSLVGVVAQAKTGKSTFISGLYMYIINNTNFLGKETEGCDVLIIDQDSQEISLKSRISRLQSQLDNKKHRLFFEYMQKLYFIDGSICEKIEEYPTAGLVIIDAWNKVGGKNFDLNGTSSVSTALEQLRTRCLSNYPGRTIVIIAHSSEHREGWTADDYMTTQDHSALAMGNSAFVESVDCYYIIATPQKGSYVKDIYVRPLSGRVMLLAEPFIVNLIQDNPEKMDLTLKEIWEPEDPEAVQHVIQYFKEVKDSATINELISFFDGQYKYNHFDKALKWLRERGRAKYEVEANDRFRWCYIQKKD